MPHERYVGMRWPTSFVCLALVAGACSSNDKPGGNSNTADGGAPDSGHAGENASGTQPQGKAGGGSGAGGGEHAAGVSLIIGVDRDLVFQGRVTSS